MSQAEGRGRTVMTTVVRAGPGARLSGAPGRRVPDRPALIVRAAVLGVAAGSRSTLGLLGPVLGRPDRSRATLLIATLATVGELIGDKLPTTPSRLEPPGLAARLLAAANGARLLVAGQQPGRDAAAAVTGRRTGRGAAAAVADRRTGRGAAPAVGPGAPSAVSTPVSTVVICAAAAVAGAAAGSWAGAAWRQAAAPALPDVVAGAVEDVVAIGLAAWACRPPAGVR